MMTKRFISGLKFILPLLPVLIFMESSCPLNAWPGEGPSLVFSAAQIESARDQAKRVSWTDAVVEGQMGDINDPIGKIWTSCLKAAMFGTEERLQAAVDQISDAASNWSLSPTLNETDFVKISRLLQAYDCLHALPEWKNFDDKSREELAARIKTVVQDLLDEDVSGINPIVERSIRLYAGLLTGATQYTQAGLYGNTSGVGLCDAAAEEISTEGLMRGCTIARHVQNGRAMMLAGAALKSSTADGFAKIEPFIMKSVEIVGELCSPNGVLPTVLQKEQPEAQELLGFLEQGRALIGEARCNGVINGVINHMYKDHPRTAASLLYGSFSVSDKVMTHVMPLTGAAILRGAKSADGQSLYLDTGLSGKHAASALLSIEWMDGAKGTAETQEKFTTDWFNTVVVDRVLQPAAPVSIDEPRNGFISSCKVFEDGATYLQASAAGQYTERPAYPADSASSPVLTYQRNLYVGSKLAVDIFRVRGGKQHDWIYHAPTDVESVIGAEMASFKAERNDYEWLKNPVEPAVAAMTKGVYGVQFKAAKGTDQRRRLWLVDPVGSQLIKSVQQSGSSIVLRRQMNGDEGDVFVAVHELIEDGKKADVEIKPLKLDPAPNLRGFQAVAFAVTQGDEVNIFLSSMNPDAEYSTEYNGARIVFQGAFGHVELSKGKLSRLRMVGGVSLRYDAHGLSMKSPISLGVVRNVLVDGNAIEVDFDYRIPTGAMLAGNSINVLAKQIAPVMYQAVIVDEVESKDIPQKIRLRHGVARDKAHPGLCAALETGSRVILENAAELIRFDEDKYSLAYTAPVDVMIESAEKRRRVFMMTSNMIRRMRGELSVGTIQFRMAPDESVDGMVEFRRIP